MSLRMRERAIAPCIVGHLRSLLAENEIDLDYIFFLLILRILTSMGPTSAHFGYKGSGPLP
jgi:hypothetical protein